MNGEELKKLRLAGFSKEELLSYQQRGKRLYQKVAKLKGVSFEQGEIIIGNELFGLGETTYKLVKEQLKNPEADLLYIEKISVLDNFSLQYGDTLSKHLLSFMRIKLNGLSPIFIEQTKIPKELLLQTMSREAYFSYLAGNKPIFEVENKEYRLPSAPSNLELMF